MNTSTCRWVRQQLAVYRPEDLDNLDLPFIKQHLATCNACEEVRCDFQQSSNLIRQLPTLTPPAAFRTAVFGAIRSEALRQAPTMSKISRAVTNPELPAVSAAMSETQSLPRRSITRLRPSTSRPFSARVSLVAVAAVLLVSLVGARLISLIGTSALSSSAASLVNASQPRIARYRLGGEYTLPTSAMATATWLVYTASDATHRSMIMAENRRTGRIIELLLVPASAPLTVRGLTDRWVVWSSGNGTASSPWALYASSLATAGTTPPIVLVDASVNTPGRPGTLATLGGVWASGDSVLAAGAPRSGAGELLKIDLSSGTPVTTVVARGQTIGDVLTDPTFANGVYYWADVWWDGLTGLHSSIWKGDETGSNQEVSSDQTAFHPQVSQNALVWVDVSEINLQQMANAVGTATPDRDLETLSALSGALDERDLATGRQWQISTNADVPSITLAGHFLLWQSGTQVHAYDLNSKAALAADSQIHSATFDSATASSIAWVESFAQDIFVYDAA